jgi:hypothetical protein
MIVSASRRTDIPAFYAPWFLRRLREGYALVRNPVNRRLVYRVPLSRETLRCIVFWTKDPRGLFPRLEELDGHGIPYYFLFTLTPYGPELERNVPDKSLVLERFAALARRLGPERVVWRYDPLLFTTGLGPAEHLRRFQSLAARLEGSTRRCITSLLALYNKTRRNLKHIPLLQLDREATASLAGELRRIAASHGIELSACACPELVAAGIPPARCVDDRLIGAITATPFAGRKDPSQRQACGCVESVDVGAYDSCLHGCLYCYANANQEAARRNAAAHEAESPLLYGRLQEGDRVVDRWARTAP